jgi:peptidoglycan hydrolase-like protein with peptidoglycan-binding domain
MPPNIRAKRSAGSNDRVGEARLTAVVVLATVAALATLGVVAIARDDGAGASDSPSTTASEGLSGVAALARSAVADTEDTDKTLPDLVGAEQKPRRKVCPVEPETLRAGDSGDDVICLQRALVKAGALDGEPSGTFDDATFQAVRQIQEERDLFVDGVAGRETALSLKIWPDEKSFVVRTPKPPEGATDLLGVPLSSVASAGKDAPPLPPDNGVGMGKRVVYSRKMQRVWAVDDDERIVRSWLVSGSQYENEVPGIHEIYSRSETSTAWNGRAFLPLMIRWYETDIGHLGFHAIPIRRSDGTRYQTEEELGTRLSGGCQRQAELDAQFLWSFAPVGTTVVVL